MKSPRTAQLRKVLVLIGDALTTIEESEAPSPALFEVVMYLRESRSHLLDVITNIERAAEAG